MKAFKILHHLPQVYHLSFFGGQADAQPRYDYWSDVYEGGQRPTLGIAGGRSGANMKALHAPVLDLSRRKQTKYDENIFEGKEVGIGFADEEEENIRLKDKKNKMVKYVAMCSMFSIRWLDCIRCC